MQTSGADVLGVLIHMERDFGETPYTAFGEFDIDILG